jgi:hypothetical protein
MNNLVSITKIIEDEWIMISSVPFSFVTAVAIGWLLIWLINRFVNRTQRDRNAWLKEQLEASNQQRQEFGQQIEKLLENMSENKVVPKTLILQTASANTAYQELRGVDAAVIKQLRLWDKQSKD